MTAAGEIPPQRWQQITEIFTSALEYQADEQARFLARVCHGDEELFQTVLALLKSNQEAGDFIETPALKLFTEAPVSASSSASVSASTPLELDERFSITAVLGRGSISTVYQVWDNQAARSLALKDLSQMDARVVEQFLANFPHYQQIRHIGLVNLYELFHRDKHCYFTMSLVNGINCLTYLRKFNPDHLSPVMNALANAVAALHDRGRLHGAIRASNVLVDNNGKVVTTDFGLIAARSSAISTRPTQSSIYLAPEATRRQSAASDWYSFGVLLYQALTGKMPFAGSDWEILLSQRRFMPPPPSQFVADIPASLDRLTQHLLQPSPELRPGQSEILAVLADTSASAKVSS